MQLKDNQFAGARRRGRRQASGYLCRDNIKDVHDWLRELLLDGANPRSYTKVEAYEYRGYRPEVRVGQKADEILLCVDKNFCSIQVLDSYSSWGLSTSLATQQEARSLPEEDVLRDSCFLAFDDGHLEVQLRTPENKLAWWHVAVVQ